MNPKQQQRDYNISLVFFGTGALLGVIAKVFVVVTADYTLMVLSALMCGVFGTIFFASSARDALMGKEEAT